MSTCTENIQTYTMPLPEAFGGDVRHEIQGPHHWVRVGKWTDITSEYVPNDGVHYKDNKGEWRVGRPYFHEQRVDRPVYECVYCLEGRRGTSPQTT